MEKLGKKFRYTRISTRITILLAGILALIMGAYTAFTMMYQRGQSEKALLHQTNYLGKTIERILRINMMENRRQDIQMAIEQVQQDEGIHRVNIYDHAGVVDYSTDSLNIGKKIDIQQYPCNQCHQDPAIGETTSSSLFHSDMQRHNDVLSVTVPIFNSVTCSNGSCHVHSMEESVLGILTVEVKPGVVLSDLRTSQVILLYFGAGLLLFAIIMVFMLIRHWVWKPVREMVKGTRRIASGNLDEPIPSGKAELGELAEAFNKMQNQLKLSQRNLLMCERLASMGKLAAGVAHEINNPLTGILTFSESLLEESQTTDPKRNDYEIIRQQALRSRDIVKKVLDFARQDEPKRELYQINTVIDNTVSLIKRLSQFQNIQIITRLEESIPEILIDSGQMEQVILNMLINASEAITGGGKIEIGTKVDSLQREVIITVEDNGTGIPETYLNNIFDPFFSTKKNTQRSNSGLGLSVSWGIVEQHNGRIEVESKEKKGTMFRIILPLVTE